MTQLSSLPHIHSSRRRFVTFGGALILAASLTLVKMTLVALDANERNIVAWPLSPEPPATAASAPSPVSLDDEKFVPWPTLLPEPAAGPNDQDNALNTAPGNPVPFGDTPMMDNSAFGFDPSTLTEGQIQALKELANRRQKLDERERLLDIRAELINRTEERLDEQISHLTSLKDRIESLVTDLDEAEEQKLARLVKIYETMKPKAAAEIFNRLEISILLHVIERMKEAKSAVVLGKMDPAVAKRVTTELARRKERPNLSDQEFGS